MERGVAMREGVLTAVERGDVKVTKSVFRVREGVWRC